MAITAKMVKALRDKTGAGMMDCKKALQETGGDIEEAALYLQKKGIASASKKAGRTAAEGLTAIQHAEDLRSATILEVNCETDFVARNDAFISFVDELVALAHAQGASTVDALNAASKDGDTVEKWVKEQVATIGENIQIRRVERFEPDGDAMVGTYVHAGSQIGVIVHVDLDGTSPEDAAEFARNVAMHIAASNPQFTAVSDIDDAAVAAQRELLTAQALESGKPANIVEKMVEGRLKKWQREVALLEQPYVKDPDLSVKKYQQQVGGVSVAGFVRYQVGEGIEKEEANLAEEVAATLKS